MQLRHVLAPLAPLAAAATLALAAGCAHQGPRGAAASPARAPGDGPAQGHAAQPSSSAVSTNARCSDDAQCPIDEICIHDHCNKITSELMECTSSRVHFDRDSSEVRVEDRPLLQRMARCLNAQGSLHVTVEGNADERGTDEYNLALGDRRATAVERYLTALGVPEGRLRAVSYGKERPLCTEHDEACWATNRRAALQAVR